MQIAIAVRHIESKLLYLYVFHFVPHLHTPYRVYRILALAYDGSKNKKKLRVEICRKLEKFSSLGEHEQIDTQQKEDI